MSPLNQPLQHDAGHNASEEGKLAEGKQELEEDIATPSDAMKEQQEKKESPELEHEADTTIEAGQAPQPLEEGSQQQGRTGEDLGTGAIEDADNQTAESVGAVSNHEEGAQDQIHPGDLVDNITTATQALDVSSTPPPEPTSKAAGKAPVPTPSPPPPPPKDHRYLNSAGEAPHRASSPLSHGRSSGRNSEDGDAANYAAKYDGGEEVGDEQSEIQSIMEQFAQGDGPPAEDIMSPRLELASPILESPVSHPPRQSSLLQGTDKPLPTPTDSSDQPLQSPPIRTTSLYRVGTNSSHSELTSPSAHAPQYKPTPPVPAPDPEPDLPFDFHRFLEQLRHRTADPVAKFLRSFLLEFGKKQWMVHEQVKIIGDFLEFISKKMAQCEVWRTVSDAEFDNAREGMEKLVMNRLYSQTFSPAIPPPEPVHPNKGRRRGGEIPPGRRGQHQEDVERDDVLAQKVRIYQWVKEEHLDIKPVGDKGRRFLLLAQQELLKIKSYRAPRDKVICVLNCCKVIFGLLRAGGSDQSADAFVPLLIYTVLQANPDHLVSNVQYILRFRNQDKLGGEAGYYISSLMGAIQFVEGLDRTSLTVTDADFEKNVEAAVSAIAEKHTEPSASESELPDNLRPQSSTAQSTPNHRRMPSPHLHLSEKSAPSRPEVTPRNSLDGERAYPRRSLSGRIINKPESGEAPGAEEDKAAVAGLLRTIQKPLSTIGRIFSDDSTPTASTSGPAQTPQPGSTPRLSPQPQGGNAPAAASRRSSEYPGGPQHQQSYSEKEPHASSDERRQRERLSAEDAAARQASAEAEEARRIQRQEHRVVVETLAGMFPDLDREVIDDVVRLKEGRVGLAVDACLALSNP